MRDAGRTPEPDLGDLFGRARTPQEVAPLPRLVRATGAALTHGGRSRRETITRALGDLRTELGVRRELRAGRFRGTATVAGSDHPGAAWPPAPNRNGAATR